MIKAWLKRWLDIAPPPPIAAPEKPQGIRMDDSMLDEARRRLDAPFRSELKAPSLPPGVLPKGAKLAMDDASSGIPQLWGWANNGLGAGLFFPGYPYLAELSQRPEYRSQVETIAEEMTRKWIEFRSTGKDSDQEEVADKIQQITAAFEELGLQDKFRRATEIDGYFGRAQLFVKIKGDEDHRNEPLLLTPETVRKGSLEGFKVIEPMWTTPVKWNSTDPTAPDFYKPTLWSVLGRETHDTRLILFLSREVPDLLKPSYNFSGISLTQMLQPYVDQWLRVKNSIADLIFNFSTSVLKTNMGTMLSGTRDEGLLKRLKFFTEFRSNRGIMAIDKDTEDMVKVDTPLSGLEGLQAQSKENMCGVSHVPPVKAFGQTPAGLNVSTEGEMDAFEDHVHARQEIQYSANINICSQLVQLNLFGEIDPSIVCDFVSLKELDGEAMARIRKSDADLAGVLLQSYVISPEEERARLAADPDSGYDNLVVSDVPEPPEMPAAEGESGEAGGDES